MMMMMLMIVRIMRMTTSTTTSMFVIKASLKFLSPDRIPSVARTITLLIYLYPVLDGCMITRSIIISAVIGCE